MGERGLLGTSHCPASQATVPPISSKFTCALHCDTKRRPSLHSQPSGWATFILTSCQNVPWPLSGTCSAWHGIAFAPKAVSLVDVVLGIVGHRSGFFGYFLILTLGIALVSALLAALVSVFSRQLGGIVGHHKYVAGSGGEAVHAIPHVVHPAVARYGAGGMQGMDRHHQVSMTRAWCSYTIRNVTTAS